MVLVHFIITKLQFEIIICIACSLIIVQETPLNALFILVNLLSYTVKVIYILLSVKYFSVNYKQL